jgi:hypothetical protein
MQEHGSTSYLLASAHHAKLNEQPQDTEKAARFKRLFLGTNTIT